MGTKITCKATFIASSRDYDLVFLIVFAKTSHMHNVTIFHKETSGVNHRGTCVNSVFDLHAFSL